MTSDEVLYEARITAVPYAARAVPHLMAYLVESLADAAGRHTLVHGVDTDTKTGPDFDTVTVRLRYSASAADEAAKFARASSNAIGPDDAHWRIIAQTVARANSA